MTDKEKIRALIERRRIAWLHGVSVEAKYKCEECKDILEFIDSLEVKEVEEVPYIISKTGKFTTTTKSTERRILNENNPHNR